MWTPDRILEQKNVGRPHTKAAPKNFELTYLMINLHC